MIDKMIESGTRRLNEARADYDAIRKQFAYGRATREDYEKARHAKKIAALELKIILAQSVNLG